MLESSIRPRVHPLIGLSAVEITRAGSILSKKIQHDSDNANKSIRFKHISLQEPPKALLLPYLDAESVGVNVDQRPFVPRCAQIWYTEPNGTQLQESCVSLDTGTVVSTLAAKKGQHAPLDRYVIWTSSLPVSKFNNTETKLSLSTSLF